MQVEVVRGEQAVTLLQTDRFRAGWIDLFERCPWASAFQSPGYVLSWYEVYRARYEPLLLFSTEGAGRPTGLVTLAVSLKDEQVQPAGGVQAEYSCWICAPESGSAFPASALEAASDVIGKGGLRLGMLPPSIPLQWLDEARVRGRCLLQSYRRPLMKFGDGRDIKRSLNKQQNRRKLKALGKLGAMSFRRLTRAEDLEPLLDTLICHHDLRHVALRGSAPFHNDPLKREFTLALMRVPGLLHATALSFGDTLAGAHIGACGRREIELGLTAYNPLLARFSPGKHLVLLLAQMLLDEGFERLDLTTGGEAYKERHANAWDQVHALTIFPSANRRRLGATKAWLGHTSKSLLHRAHVNPTIVRSLAREMSIASLAGTAARALKSRTGKNRSMLILARDLSGNFGEPPYAIRCNIVEDLLAYRPLRGMPSRRQFVSDALRRLEDGQRLYTHVADGMLAHAGWLSEGPSQKDPSDSEFPRDCAIVRHLETFAAFRRHGIAAASLCAMAHDAAKLAGVARLGIAVRSGDTRARRWLQSQGFSPVGPSKVIAQPAEEAPAKFADKALEGVGK